MLRSICPERKPTRRPPIRNQTAWFRKNMEEIAYITAIMVRVYRERKTGARGRTAIKF